MNYYSNIKSVLKYELVIITLISLFSTIIYIIKQFTEKVYIIKEAIDVLDIYCYIISLILILITNTILYLFFSLFNKNSESITKSKLIFVKVFALIGIVMFNAFFSISFRELFNPSYILVYYIIRFTITICEALKTILIIRLPIDPDAPTDDIDIRKPLN